MKSLNRKDIIQAVRLAAKDAAQNSTNPAYVEALELAVVVLETNDWVKPKRRPERIRGGAMLIEASTLVSDCCSAIALFDDDDNYQCSKCQQECTASKSLSEAYGKSETTIQEQEKQP